MQGYAPDLGKNTYCIISGALLYDHTYMGQKYHIVIHQAIEIPDFNHHLLCLMQVHTNGFKVMNVIYF